MEDFPAHWRVSNFQNEFFPYALKYALYMVTAHGYTFKVNKGTLRDQGIDSGTLRDGSFSVNSNCLGVRYGVSLVDVFQHM